MLSKYFFINEHIDLSGMVFVASTVVIILYNISAADFALHTYYITIIYLAFVSS